MMLVYLLRSNDEVFSAYKIFHEWVKTRFQTKIRISRHDNGKEYLSKAFLEYVQGEGTESQTTCSYTPKQNGVAKRKNQHLLEVTRALLIGMLMPKSYWLGAVFTACYLINILPTKVLNGLSPIQFSSRFHPVSDIPLKIFGFVHYVYNHDPNKNKLSNRAIKCVFFRYSSSQKGYKCFDPVAKRKYVSMDVKFF